MNVKLGNNNLEGTIKIPPSKSLSHRAIIAAALARGQSKISNIIYSEDILATIDALKALGINFRMEEDYIIVNGGNLYRKMDVINAKESGSTLRFMIPIMMTIAGKMTFEGENNLVNRPLDVYISLFDRMNIRYEKGEKALPLTVYDTLKPGIYEVPGDVSSQFITGLLYALCLLDDNSKIVVTTPLESKGYIDLTLDVLNKFGICIKHDNYQVFYIDGNQEYKCCDYTVESDFSQAAFFLASACFGSKIRLKNLPLQSYQSDKAIISILQQMKANIKILNDDIIVEPSITYGTTIDLANCPDLGPIVIVLAALSKGVTNIINAKRLRIKESDRLHAMYLELTKLGAKIIELEDGMIIYGVDKFNGGICYTHNDHRICMALSIASQKADGDIILFDADCVKKSYPDFFKALHDAQKELIFLNKLEMARYVINDLDMQMIKLFEKRMQASFDVAMYKKENGLPVYDAKREESLINRNVLLLENQALKDYYLHFFKTLLTVSKEYQKNEM